MQYKKLGRTGLMVSRLCLGTMNFGDVTDKQTSFEIMDRSFELGINFIDTADVYGGPQRPDIPLGYGISEEIVGQWIKASKKRDEIVLATKLYQPMIAGPNGGRLSAYHIRKACEDSLRRLQTDHIDLYQMHHFDRTTPWEEIWQAMDVLVRQGKVLYVGTGENPDTLRFYERNGFEYSHTVKDFFSSNYDHPIYENGKMLRDMVYLKCRL